jgi:hypothetical protein
MHSKNTGLNESDHQLVKVDLPYADWIMGLGIASLSLSFLTGIIGLILGIVALNLYKKPFELYKLAPELYHPSSYRNIKVGRILGIIGVIFSSVVTLIFLVIFILFAGFLNLVS